MCSTAPWGCRCACWLATRTTTEIKNIAAASTCTDPTGSPRNTSDNVAPAKGALANTPCARTAPTRCAAAVCSAMLAPYETAPTAIAATTAAASAITGARASPSAKFVMPATAPFHSVLRAGVMPSMSAERRLSAPQQVHAPTTSKVAGQGVPPGLPDSRALAATTPATPSHATRLRCSWNSTTPSTAVATISKFKSSDTAPAVASRNAASNKIGATIPPRITTPARRLQFTRSSSIGPKRARSEMTTGTIAPAAPRYRSPASCNGSKNRRSSLLAGAEAPKRTAAANAKTKPYMPPAYHGPHVQYPCHRPRGQRPMGPAHFTEL